MARRKRYELRLIPAWEAMEAEREAAGQGSSLWRNACVLARALYRGRTRVFPSGEAVLKAMPAQTVACWMAAYNRLCMDKVESWQEEKAALARDGWGRLRWKAMRAMGLWPKNPGDMTDGDFLYCILQLILDGEERLQALCPSCRADLLGEGCPVCGAAVFEENPNFDEKRFEELKRHGSSALADAAAADGMA